MGYDKHEKAITQTARMLTYNPHKNFTDEGEIVLGISLARPGRNGR